MLFDVIVKGLLPHGVIELAAIVIACAYGLRFGKMILQGIGSTFTRKERVGAGFRDSCSAPFRLSCL